MKIVVEIELGEETQPMENWKKTRAVKSVKVNGKKVKANEDGNFDFAESTWPVFADDIHNLDLVRS